MAIAFNAANIIKKAIDVAKTRGGSIYNLFEYIPNVISDAKTLGFDIKSEQIGPGGTYGNTFTSALSYVRNPGNENDFIINAQQYANKFKIPIEQAILQYASQNAQLFPEISLSLDVLSGKIQPQQARSLNSYIQESKNVINSANAAASAQVNINGLNRRLQEELARPDKDQNVINSVREQLTFYQDTLAKSTSQLKQRATDLTQKYNTAQGVASSFKVAPPSEVLAQFGQRSALDQISQDILNQQLGQPSVDITQSAFARAVPTAPQGPEAQAVAGEQAATTQAAATGATGMLATTQQATQQAAAAPSGNYTVADMYYQFLGREPDAAGLSFWNQAIKGGATPGVDPEEITAFLTSAVRSGEQPSYFANVTTRPVATRGDEGEYIPFMGPQYTPAPREGDQTFEGQKYFEADKQNILNQLKAQQSAGMKYTASFTNDENEILNDLATRLAAQGVKDLTDIKPIMSGETLSDSGEGQMVRGESIQVGLFNSKTGEPINMKMLTNNKGDGTTNYQAAFVNGVPVFTASKAATGVKQIQQDFGPLLAVAASAILPGLSIGGTPLGQLVGQSLGLTGTAATSVGNAIVSGLGTGAVTGSVEKGLVAAALVGGGSFLRGSGQLGDIMDRLGLGEFRQGFGVLNSAQAGDISFVAADAAQLAAQGLGVEGIQQNLIAAGVDATVAASAANLAATGLNANQIATDLTNFTGGQNIFTGVDTGAATGITTGTGAGQTGLGTTTTGGGGLLTGAGTTAGGTALGSGLTTGTGGATLGGGTTGTTLGSGLTTGTGGAVLGGGLTGGLTSGLTGGLASTLGGGLASGLLSGLTGNLGNILGTGINYAVQQRQIDQLLGVGNAAAARLEALANKTSMSPAEYAELGRLAQEAKSGSAAAGAAASSALQRIAANSALPASQYQELTRLAQQVKTESAAAGAASQVPFTPYTMTTGFGTTAVTPSGATAFTAPEYEALRQQSLGLAGQTMGAINPAQTAADLYSKIEAIAAPGREREQLALQQRLQRQGLSGFGTTLPTTGGGVRTVSPLFESLLSAQETARAQQALQAQQFGTTEAQRQAALAQGLLGQAQGIDQQTLAQLQQTGALGINLNQLEQANRARALQAQLAGISAPLTTGITSAQLQQSDLARQAQLQQAGVLAQLQSTMAGMNLPLTTGLSAAQLRQADLARQAQLGQAGSTLQTQAAIAALGPQQQQTQAVGNLAQGLLSPIAGALGRGINELFGL